MVIWIIGLAGSGKTTVGTELYRRLKREHPSLVLIDGDMVREIMGNDLGHTVEDRRKNAVRICNLCRALDQQNIHAVACVLSIFHESQEWNRRNYSRYFEIFLDVSMETLVKRDQKGLYSGAMKGEIRNVVGVDIPFEPPRNPDYVVDNDEARQDFGPVVTEILRALPPLE
jgi:adenylylsulfate kinase